METYFWRLKFVIALMVLTLYTGVSTAQSEKTFLVGERATMVCPIGSVGSFQWRDVEDAGSFTALYTREASGLVISSEGLQNNPAKYAEYDYDATSETEFILIIESVKVADNGRFQCVDLINSAQVVADVSVSVNGEPQSVAIICVPNDVCPDATLEPTTSSQFTCTCTAINAYPDSLDLTWDGAVQIQAANGVPSTNKTGYFNIFGTAAVTPTESSNTVTCTVNGYTNEIPLARRRASYSFTPPSCRVTVKNIDPDCTTAELRCNCDHLGVPESSRYLSNDGTDYQQQDSDTWMATIAPSEPYSFYCRGCNGVNYGTGLTDASGICEPNSTGISTGWTVAAVVEFFALITLILVSWLCWERQKYNSKENVPQRSNILSSLREDAVNPGYMDLEEKTTLTQQEVQLREIPEQNVKLGPVLPGRGLVMYQQGTVIRNSRNQDVVVKSLSGRATVDLARHWSSEINIVMKIQQHNNVTQFIGWCNSVPNLLITELINGGNLQHYIMENYSPHRLHQYGNTKRKKFQVPERGNPENLSKFALDVARGLRFLLDNKFIHPGLRAQKVLLDSAGRCKLYDFVTIERSKEITSLLWMESVPYQWMPPEYLLLGTISAAGDIWSLGVLLWEIYSFGSKPYQDESRIGVENSLRNGERLSMPMNCPGAMWQLMIQCWEQSGESRPKLQEITSKLSVVCNDDKEYDEMPNIAPMV